VVDDWEDTREALRLLLEDWSCAVDTADNGEEGLCLALNGNYDAVILDLNLPDVDGLEVGRAISQTSPRRPYLRAFSALASPLDRQRTRIAGFDRHLAKGSATALTSPTSHLSPLLGAVSEHGC